MILQPGFDKIAIDGRWPILYEYFLPPFAEKKGPLLVPDGRMIEHAVGGMQSSNNQCLCGTAAPEATFQDAAVDKVGILGIAQGRIEPQLMGVEKSLSDRKSDHGDPKSGLKQQGMEEIFRRNRVECRYIGWNFADC